MQPHLYHHRQAFPNGNTVSVGSLGSDFKLVTPCQLQCIICRESWKGLGPHTQTWTLRVPGFTGTNPFFYQLPCKGVRIRAP